MKILVMQGVNVFLGFSERGTTIGSKRKKNI